jgi:hypothetical protein
MHLVDRGEKYFNSTFGKSGAKGLASPKGGKRFSLYSSNSTFGKSGAKGLPSAFG